MRIYFLDHKHIFRFGDSDTQTIERQYFPDAKQLRHHNLCILATFLVLNMINYAMIFPCILNKYIQTQRSGYPGKPKATSLIWSYRAWAVYRESSGFTIRIISSQAIWTVNTSTTERVISSFILNHINP